MADGGLSNRIASALHVGPTPRQPDGAAGPLPGGVQNGADYPRIVVVTEPGQLPSSFLNPPGGAGGGELARPPGLVVGFDCEGVGLSRHGQLCVMQLAIEGAVYLVDVVAGGRALIEACRPALESRAVVKVIHDCRRDAEALFFQFGIKLQGVFDTQVAHFLIDGTIGAENVSFVNLLAMQQYCGAAYEEKHVMREKLNQDPQFWLQRPWTDEMMRAAGDDVRYLPLVHARMLPLLSPALLRRLAVRSALRCCSFCCASTADQHDWPRAVAFPASFEFISPASAASPPPTSTTGPAPVPSRPPSNPISAELDACRAGTSAGNVASTEGGADSTKDGEAHPDESDEDAEDPEKESDGAQKKKKKKKKTKKKSSEGEERSGIEGGGEDGALGDVDEVLAVIDIPPGSMGRVIGKQGSSIKAIRQSCPGAEIFLGSNKGPADKVFVIGPKKETQMAEAIISGKFRL